MSLVALGAPKHVFFSGAHRWASPPLHMSHVSVCFYVVVFFFIFEYIYLLICISYGFILYVFTFIYDNCNFLLKPKIHNSSFFANSTYLFFVTLLFAPKWSCADLADLWETGLSANIESNIESNVWFFSIFVTGTENRLSNKITLFVLKSPFTSLDT